MNGMQLKTKQQTTFESASQYFEPKFDHKRHSDRTQRNHFWIGGDAGMKALRNMTVGVAGLGGMGSNIAEALVRLGVGGLRIADPDTIDLSNVNRQVIANRNSVEKGKAETSAQELRQIAEDYELAVYNKGITEQTVEEFVEGCDAVVDEIDVFPLDKHVLLHRACEKRNIPVYSAYVVGVGIHFYKFHGDYTFEKFLDLDPKQWTKPTPEFLLKKFGPPFSNYLKNEVLDGYAYEISTGKVPIFGPATLMGHSIVSTRVVFDYLKGKVDFPTAHVDETPVMPEFLALDSCDFSFKKAHVKESGI